MYDLRVGSDIVFTFVTDNVGSDLVAVFVVTVVYRCPFLLLLSFVLVVEKLVAKLV